MENIKNNQTVKNVVFVFCLSATLFFASDAWVFISYGPRGLSGGNHPVAYFSIALLLTLLSVFFLVITVLSTQFKFAHEKTTSVHTDISEEIDDLGLALFGLYTLAENFYRFTTTVDIPEVGKYTTFRGLYQDLGKSVNTIRLSMSEHDLHACYIDWHEKSLTLGVFVISLHPNDEAHGSEPVFTRKFSNTDITKQFITDLKIYATEGVFQGFFDKKNLTQYDIEED